MGKGSTRRPGDDTAFRANYDAIFAKKEEIAAPAPRPPLPTGGLFYYTPSCIYCNPYGEFGDYGCRGHER